jgi:hypothetical protein
MSRRSRLASLVLGVLLAGRETTSRPEPDAGEPALDSEDSASDPAPRDLSLPAPDDELWPTFPPIWRKGERWRVSMVTEKEISIAMGSPTNTIHGYVVYEFRVAEVPAMETGFYRLDATSIRADDTVLRRYHVYYRKKPFSFAKLVRLEDDGTPEIHPVWQQPANEEPHPERHQQFRFFTDFPIMPDHPWLGEATYSLPDGRPSWVQKVERTADGLRFTVGLPGGGLESVMDWKRGAPWWSSLGRYHSGFPDRSEMYFDGSGLLVE